MSRFLDGSVTTPVHVLISHSTCAPCDNQLHLTLYPYEVGGVNEGLDGFDEDVSIITDHLMVHPCFKEILDSLIFQKPFSDISQIPVYESKYQSCFEIPTIFSTFIDLGIPNHAIQVKHENQFNLIFHLRAQQSPIVIQNFLLGLYTCLMDAYHEHYATSEEMEYVHDALHPL